MQVLLIHTVTQEEKIIQIEQPSSFAEMQRLYRAIEPDRRWQYAESF